MSAAIGQGVNPGRKPSPEGSSIICSRIIRFRQYPPNIDSGPNVCVHHTQKVSIALLWDLCPAQTIKSAQRECSTGWMGHVWIAGFHLFATVVTVLEERKAKF
jgi:hypothetical protein